MLKTYQINAIGQIGTFIPEFHEIDLDWAIKSFEVQSTPEDLIGKIEENLGDFMGMYFDYKISHNDEIIEDWEDPLNEEIFNEIY